MCVDSPSYIMMALSREPLYPTFLALNRLIFKDPLYLKICVFEQGILAALAAYYLTAFIRKRGYLSGILSYVPLIIMLGVSCMCRFIAGRGSMYSNCILSEGITIPLFVIFICFLYEYLIDHSLNRLIISAVVSLLLISARKQMYLSLILLFLVILYVSVKEQKKGLKGMLLAVVCAIAVLVSNYAYENMYHLAINGDNVTHFNDNRFLATVCYYVSERSDGDEIAVDEYRELFYEIYDACDADGSLMHDAPDGIFALADHFAAHYDMIQIDHMWPMTEEAAEHMTGTVTLSDGADEQIITETMTDNIMSYISSRLLKKNIGRIIKVAFADYVQGAVNTVAKSGGFLNIAGLIIWLIYVILLVMTRFRSGRTSARYGQMREISAFSILVLMSSVLNILLVGSFIFCQTRYMIYNMPLFYTGMFLMGVKNLYLTHPDSM